MPTPSSGLKTTKPPDKGSFPLDHRGECKVGAGSPLTASDMCET
jgi:hypothetical protein